MGKDLVIVESPAKARTLSRILGGQYNIKASYGHVRDLPAKKFGVDVDNGFEPIYETADARKKTIKELKDDAKQAGSIYLATDPDREGEAIAWHLQQLLGGNGKFQRVTFHEITKPAVQAAFQHPGSIANERVEAQVARRILDRMVGYEVSPMLWRRVERGTSAGRVQTVALRLIVERAGTRPAARAGWMPASKRASAA